MNKIKWLIVFIIFIIIILVVSLLFIPKKNESSNNINIEENDIIDENQINEEEKNQVNTPPELNLEPGYREYYTVINCVSNYLDALNVSNLTEEQKNERNNTIKSLTNYKDNNLSFNEKVVFIPIKMIRKTPTKIDTYVVSGIISNNKMDIIEDNVVFIVNLDNENKTFSIQKVNGNYNNLEQIDVGTTTSIEKNEYNIFDYQEINQDYKYKQMFNNIKRLILVKPEIAYNYLDEEYKEKRFGSLNYFKQYVENNRQHLSGITPKSYKENDDYTIITIQDQYSNLYEFNIKGTMKYSVKIDDYIILLPSNIEKYKKYSDNEKVKYNINRWIKMLNSKDYKYAYLFLDEQFKQNKFSSEEEFSEFMNNKYPNYYDLIQIENIKTEGNIYMVEVKLSIKNEDFSDKYININLRLDEDTNFTVSFNE